MKTKRIDLSELPKQLKYSIISRSIKIKKINKESSIYKTMVKENNEYMEAQYISFSSLYCNQKINKMLTFVILNSKGKLIGHAKLKSSEFKTIF
jgi:hypothetical protein